MEDWFCYWLKWQSVIELILKTKDVSTGIQENIEFISVRRGRMAAIYLCIVCRMHYNNIMWQMCRQFAQREVVAPSGECTWMQCNWPKYTFYKSEQFRSMGKVFDILNLESWISWHIWAVPDPLKLNQKVGINARRGRCWGECTIQLYVNPYHVCGASDG